VLPVGGAVTKVPTEEEFGWAKLDAQKTIPVFPDVQAVTVQERDVSPPPDAVQVPVCTTVSACDALIVYAALPTAESVYVAFVPIAFTVCVVATLIGVE
jgi:hypothetical protein